MTRLDAPSLLLLALACYRVTRFLVHDSLMGASPDSGSWWSTVIDGFGYQEGGENRSWIRGKIADLLTCHYCLSFWICLAGYVALAGVPKDGYAVADGVTVFALAGLVSLVYEFLDRESVTNVIVPKR